MNALQHEHDPSVLDGSALDESTDWSALAGIVFSDEELLALSSLDGRPQISASTTFFRPLSPSASFSVQQVVSFPEQRLDLGSSSPQACNTGLEIPSRDVQWPQINTLDFRPEDDLVAQPDSLQPPQCLVSAGLWINSLQNDLPWPDCERPYEEDNKRRKRPRIPPPAKKLLEDHFERYREDPYVPTREMEDLAAQTGLSLRQVRTFFANARARKLPKVPKPESREGRSSPNIDIVRPRREKEGADPMERFLSSSPEEEGLSEDAVRDAASNMEPPPAPLTHRQHTSLTDALSVSDSTRSSASSSSATSIDSVNNRGPRRGRKRRREPSAKSPIQPSIARKPSSPSRKYQCTFCTLDFAQKYDWRRHEESVHFPQKEWVCMPDGPVETSCCIFCGEREPDQHHLERHKAVSCSEMPRDQRAFLRKDKLIQHIKQVHSCQPPATSAEWCRTIERDVLFVCGLCGRRLPDWATRIDHLASHFMSGITMEMWLSHRCAGIIAARQGYEEFFTRCLSPESTTSGGFACGTCSERFKRESHVVLHRRQIHDMYHVEKKGYLMMYPISEQQTSPSDEDDELRRRTAGVTLALQNEAQAESSVARGREPPESSRSSRIPLSGGIFPFGPNSSAMLSTFGRPTPRLDHRATHSEQRPKGHVPFTPRIPLSSYSGIPTSRVGSGQSLVSNPHSDWKFQLYTQGRNTSQRSATPILGHKSNLPATTSSAGPARISSNHTHPPSFVDGVYPQAALPSAQLGNPSSAPPQTQQQLPASPGDTYFTTTTANTNTNTPNPTSHLLPSTLRAITHRLRTNARTTTYPAHGMLHSLEQLHTEQEEEPWPSPYEVPPLPSPRSST